MDGVSQHHVHGEVDGCSFYFTNVLEQILYVEFRKRVKVCDMLSDVYLSAQKIIDVWYFGLHIITMFEIKANLCKH